jgi:hypothetical protein
VGCGYILLGTIVCCGSSYFWLLNAQCAEVLTDVFVLG